MCFINKLGAPQCENEKNGEPIDEKQNKIKEKKMNRRSDRINK